FEATFERAFYYIAVSRGSSEPPHQVNEMSGFQDYRWCIRNAWFIQAMGGTGMTFWDFKSDYWGLVTGQGWRYNRKEKVQFKESYLAVQQLNSMFRKIMDILGASPPLEPSIGVLLLDENSFHESGVAVAPAMRYLSLLLWKGYGSETAIATEDHLDYGRVDKFKLIIAPHIKYISQSHAEKLKEYVEKGGVLLVGPFAGEFDEKGDPYSKVPCEPLAEILGLEAEVDLDKEILAHLARVREYLPIRLRTGSWILETIPPWLEGHLWSVLRRSGLNLDPNAREGWNFLARYLEAKYREAYVAEDFEALRRGDVLKCISVQKIALEKAKGICVCGETPVLAVNKYGEGYVIYSAGVFSKESLEKILGSALSLVGLAPYAKVYSPIKQGVIWGVRRTPDGYILIVIEAADKRQEIKVELNASRMNFKKCEVVDLFRGGKIELDYSNPKFTTQIDLCGVKVYHIILS
ncbi:MAG: hypothetical protein DRJ52_11385, partial [Thermoprotei archaeon]